MKKTIIFVVILLLLLGGVYFYFNSEQAPEENNPEEEVVEEVENEENAEQEEVEEEVEDEENSEEENEEESSDQQEDAEEDVYEAAEETTPMAELNVAMNEDLKGVLEEIFESEAKLTSTGQVEVLSYVVERPITDEDVSEMRDLLVEAGYEIEGVDSGEDKYEFNLSAEILGQEYQGNIYVVAWTGSGGENAQRVVVRIL